jgi:hypothetical protein
MERRRRPENVTFICYFYWLHALAAVFSVALVVSSAFAPPFGDTYLFRSGTGAMTGVILACCLSPILGAIATLFAVVGWGLWQLKPWARHAAIGVSGLLIALGLPSLLIGGCGALYGLVLYSLVIWQLSYKGVKAAFEPGSAARLHPGTRAKDLPLRQR